MSKELKSINGTFQSESTNTMQEIKEPSKYIFLYFFFTCLISSVLLINLMY